MILLIAITLAALVVATTFYKNWNRSRKRLPPSPLSVPIIGHLHLWTNPKEMVNTAVYYANKLGGIFSMDFGSKTFVFISDASLIKEAVVKHRNVLSDRPLNDFHALRTIYSTDPRGGCVTSDHNDYHKGYRYIFKNDLASGKGMKKINKIIDNEINAAITAFTQRSKDGEVVTGSEVSYAMTFNMITTLLFGIRAYKKDNNELSDLFKVSKAVMEGALVPFLQDIFPMCSVLETKRVAEFSSLLEQRNQIFGDIVKNARDTYDPEETRHWLDIILTSMPEKTDGELIAFLNEMVAAGFDTTAHGLQTAFTMLSKHPDIQVKLREAIGDKDISSMSVKELQAISYLKNFVQEVFRIKPIAPLQVPHKARESVTIGGYNVPKNSIVYLMHQSECYNDTWDEPSKFNPSRWEKPQQTKINPFGQGVRRCPGERIAITLLYKAIPSLVQQFNWTETDKPNSVELEFATIQKYKYEPLFHVNKL